MAADCSRVYVLTPAVWWTTANDSAVAYDGAARRISSFAFHCVRVPVQADEVEGRRGGRERARRRLQRHVARDDRRKSRGRRRRKREHGQESDDETHGRTLRQGAWSTLQVARDHPLP